MSDMRPQGTLENSVEKGYEHADAHIASIIAIGVFLLTSTMVVMLAMVGMFGYLSKREAARDKLVAPLQMKYHIVPPLPRLQPSPYDAQNNADPTIRGQQELAEQIVEADSYQRDPATGAIHLPVDRAIDLVAAQGLPTLPMKDAAALHGARQPHYWDAASGGGTAQRWQDENFPSYANFGQKPVYHIGSFEHAPSEIAYGGQSHFQ